MEVNIAKEYMDGLKKAYIENGGKSNWDKFEKVIHGAGEAEIEDLKKTYPDVPNSILELLKIVDGTYWREYQGEEIIFYLLGSDMEEYPYYLLSTRQMIDNQSKIYNSYADYVNREYEAEDVSIDERIIGDAKKMNWLHFSDCMNNGGTSQLFVDFSPSDKGVSGQILRFLHDPDEIEVIANSFDEYLQMLMESEYNFINEDTIDEDF